MIGVVVRVTEVVVGEKWAFQKGVHWYRVFAYIKVMEVNVVETHKQSRICMYMKYR